MLHEVNFHDKPSVLRRKLVSLLAGSSCSKSRLVASVFLVAVALVAFIGVIVNQQDSQNLPEAINGAVKHHPEKPDENGVTITEEIVEVMGTHVFVRRATPSEQKDFCLSVVLLHGAAFSSKLWQNFGTMSLLASKTGCPVFAVDLPTGSADAGRLTQPADIAPAFRGAFLTSLVRHLAGSTRVILVAPSMSASYAVPMLVQQSATVAGLVAVAPLLSESLTDEQARHLSALKVPALLMFGEWDGRGRKSTESLVTRALPRAQVKELPEARHAAYVDQPDKFHKLLLKFVSKVISNQHSAVAQNGDDDEED